MSPSHSRIRQSIIPLDDLELMDWISSPDSYTLSPKKLDLPDHQGWILRPSGVRTDVSVLLVEDATGRIQLASGCSSTVARLLGTQPAISAESLARLFLQLWVEPSRRTRLVRGSARLQKSGLRRTLRFVAHAAPREPRPWTVSLSPHHLQLQVG